MIMKTFCAKVRRDIHSVEKPAYRYRSFAVAARLGVLRCHRVFIVIGEPHKRQAPIGTPLKIAGETAKLGR